MSKQINSNAKATVLTSPKPSAADLPAYYGPAQPDAGSAQASKAGAGPTGWEALQPLSSALKALRDGKALPGEASALKAALAQAQRAYAVAQGDSWSDPGARANYDGLVAHALAALHQATQDGTRAVQNLSSALKTPHNTTQLSNALASALSEQKQTGSAWTPQAQKEFVQLKNQAQKLLAQSRSNPSAPSGRSSTLAVAAPARSQFKPLNADANSGAPGNALGWVSGIQINGAAGRNFQVQMGTVNGQRALAGPDKVVLVPKEVKDLKPFAKQAISSGKLDAYELQLQPGRANAPTYLPQAAQISVNSATPAQRQATVQQVRSLDRAIGQVEGEQSAYVKELKDRRTLHQSLGGHQFEPVFSQTLTQLNRVREGLFKGKLSVAQARQEQTQIMNRYGKDISQARAQLAGRAQFGATVAQTGTTVAVGVAATVTTIKTGGNIKAGAAAGYATKQGLDAITLTAARAQGLSAEPLVQQGLTPTTQLVNKVLNQEKISSADAVHAASQQVLDVGGAVLNAAGVSGTLAKTTALVTGGMSAPRALANAAAEVQFEQAPVKVALTATHAMARNSVDPSLNAEQKAAVLQQTFASAGTSALLDIAGVYVAGGAAGKVNRLLPGSVSAQGRLPVGNLAAQATTDITFNLTRTATERTLQGQSMTQQDVVEAVGGSITGAITDMSALHPAKGAHRAGPQAVPAHAEPVGPTHSQSAANVVTPTPGLKLAAQRSAASQTPADGRLPSVVQALQGQSSIPAWDGVNRINNDPPGEAPFIPRSHTTESQQQNPSGIDSSVDPASSKFNVYDQIRRLSTLPRNDISPFVSDLGTHRVLDLSRAKSLGTIPELKQQVEAIQRIQPDIRINCAGCDLGGVDLSGMRLQHADFSGAKLQDANLSGANLRGVSFHSADLSNANLSGTNLEVANLKGSNLARANLTNARLGGANLSQSDMFGSILHDANLIETNLRSASFENADLMGASLYRADAESAVFRQTNLVGAYVAGANLRGADLSGAEATRANFYQAELSDTNLVQTNLSFANLQAANLSGAQLDGANLFGSKLEGAIVVDSAKERAVTRAPGTGGPDDPMRPVPDLEALRTQAVEQLSPQYLDSMSEKGLTYMGTGVVVGVRHGRTDHNEIPGGFFSGAVKGKEGAQLLPQSRDLARALGPEITAIAPKINAVFVSNVDRAIETYRLATFSASETLPPPIYAKWAEEHHVGGLAGQTKPAPGAVVKISGVHGVYVGKDIYGTLGKDKNRMPRDYVPQDVYPGMRNTPLTGKDTSESWNGMYDRVARGVQADVLPRLSRNENVLVFGHQYSLANQDSYLYNAITPVDPVVSGHNVPNSLPLYRVIHVFKDPNGILVPIPALAGQSQIKPRVVATQEPPGPSVSHPETAIPNRRKNSSEETSSDVLPTSAIEKKVAAPDNIEQQAIIGRAQDLPPAHGPNPPGIDFLRAVPIAAELFQDYARQFVDANLNHFLWQPLNTHVTQPAVEQARHLINGLLSTQAGQHMQGLARSANSAIQALAAEDTPLGSAVNFLNDAVVNNKDLWNTVDKAGDATRAVVRTGAVGALAALTAGWRAGILQYGHFNTGDKLSDVELEVRRSVNIPAGMDVSYWKVELPIPVHADGKKVLMPVRAFIAVGHGSNTVLLPSTGPGKPGAQPWFGQDKGHPAGPNLTVTSSSVGAAKWDVLGFSIGTTNFNTSGRADLQLLRGLVNPLALQVYQNGKPSASLRSVGIFDVASGFVSGTVNVGPVAFVPIRYREMQSERFVFPNPNGIVPLNRSHKSVVEPALPLSGSTTWNPEASDVQVLKNVLSSANHVPGFVQRLIDKDLASAPEDSVRYVNPNPADDVSHDLQPIESADPRAGLSGTLFNRMPEHLPPQRTQAFDFSTLSGNTLRQVLDILETNAYPVSSPAYVRPGDPVFATLFQALERVGCRTLSMAELQGLLGSNVKSHTRSNTGLVRPGDLSIQFDPNVGLASPHELHFLFGGLRTVPKSEVSKFTAGLGGEDSVFARVTDEFNQYSPHQWGVEDEIFRFLSKELNETNRNSSSQAPDRFWQQQRDDLVQADSADVGNRLKQIADLGHVTDPRQREIVRPFFNEIVNSAANSAARASAVDLLITNLRDRSVLTQRVSVSGMTAEIQLLETVYRFLQTKNLNVTNPKDQIDFVELYKYYQGLVDSDALTKPDAVRNWLQNNGIAVAE